MAYVLYQLPSGVCYFASAKPVPPPPPIEPPDTTGRPRCRLCDAVYPMPTVIVRAADGWTDDWFVCGHERPVTCPACEAAERAKPDRAYPKCSVCGEGGVYT